MTDDLRSLARRVQREALAVLIGSLRSANANTRANAARQLLQIANDGEAQLKLPWECSDAELDQYLRACEARGLISEADIDQLENEVVEPHWDEPDPPPDAPLPTSTDDATRDDALDTRERLRETMRRGLDEVGASSRLSDCETEDALYDAREASTIDAPIRRRVVLTADEKEPTKPTSITILVTNSTTFWGGRHYKPGRYQLSSPFVLRSPVLKALIVEEEKHLWGIEP